MPLPARSGRKSPDAVASVTSAERCSGTFVSGKGVPWTPGWAPLSGGSRGLRPLAARTNRADYGPMDIMAGCEVATRIVVGVHGTAASDAAVAWAVREARLRRATLHLLLVRDPATSRRAPYAPHPDQSGDDADVTLLAQAARRAARQVPADRVTSELVAGLPAKVLAERATGAAMLVLGVSGLASRPDGTVGPVARACLRHPPCPVVVLIDPDMMGAVGLPAAHDARESAAVAR